MKLSFFTVFLTFLFCLSSLANSTYPSHWWKVVEEKDRKGSWEILPHEAKEGELILSKRNELGQFSNLAASSFVFEGVRYASVEALWQMMKYPDPNLKNDPRMAFSDEYPYSRAEVIDLSGFPSKKAGSAANKVNRAHSIQWISYKNQVFNYKDFSTGSSIHYKIIFSAIGEKLRQNPHLIELLLKTKGLILKPDHTMKQPVPPSYEYHKILMLYRDRILSPNKEYSIE
jgi:predicted NAD-dependent protein-ADP-ribosyltransferase YbiA (DUF1768 family)